MDTALLKSPMRALPALECPLCGAANQCAVAASGSLATPCWCERASMPAELLATLAPDQRGVACVCPACAGRALDEPGAPDTRGHNSAPR